MIYSFNKYVVFYNGWGKWFIKLFYYFENL